MFHPFYLIPSFHRHISLSNSFLSSFQILSTTVKDGQMSTPYLVFCPLIPLFSPSPLKIFPLITVSACCSDCCSALPGRRFVFQERAAAPITNNICRVCLQPAQLFPVLLFSVNFFCFWLPPSPHFTLLVVTPTPPPNSIFLYFNQSLSILFLFF